MRNRPWPLPFTPWLPRPAGGPSTTEGCITCGAPCQPGLYFCPDDSPVYVERAS